MENLEAGFGMKNMKWRVVLCGLCLASAAFAGTSYAQNTNSGDIRGTVTDASGAVISGATVTVLNVNTGVSKDYVSDSAGVYDTSSIVPGTYTVTFSKDGFTQVVRGPITVQVGFLGVNAQLQVGSVTEKIVVNTDIPLLQTENGEQSTTLDSKSMARLPQYGQDWENFIILLPGTAGTAMGGNYSTNPGQTASANGNMPYSTILSDGAANTLSHSSNADVTVFEDVAELQASTSSFSAQYGVGGIVYNQISKGGTSRFHGSAYDYIMNDAFDARPYVFPGQGIQPVPKLRVHNFGATLGGPILKKKMFFFANYDAQSNHSSATGYATVPNQAVMSGDFTGFYPLYDPTTQVISYDANGNVVVQRQTFAQEYGNGNKIPASMIDPVAKAFQSYYPTPGNHPSFGTFVPGQQQNNGEIFNNWYTDQVLSYPVKKYFGRLDYDITPNNRLTLSNTQRDTPQVQVGIVNCPISCELIDIDSNNAQISDVWNISNNTVNEARIGFTKQLNFFIDDTLGKGYPAQLGWQFAKADGWPNMGVGDYANMYPQTNVFYKELNYDVGDVVTMIRGKHVLHFGGEVLIYQENSTAWGNVNGGTMNFSGQYTQGWSPTEVNGVLVDTPDETTGNPYADFLLGTMHDWNAGVTPEYGARLKTPQIFVQDDIKLKSNLTLNVGVRYQIQPGWSEIRRNMRSFDLSITNPATGTPGAEWYGETGAHGRTTLQAATYNTVLPRIGFSWLMKPDTTIRGGFGLYAYNWSLDTYGNGMGNSLGSSGNIADQTNGVYSIGQLSGNGSNLPYVTSSTDPAAYNGQDVDYNLYHTPVPQSWQWNLGIQHSVGSNLSVELTYVGSHGRNLTFPVNINQIPDAKLSPNDGPQDRPFPNYQAVNDRLRNAISNYNSLQTQITKRLSSGLSFNFNYVWSHFLSDMDSSGMAGNAGEQNYQSYYNLKANYASSNFDVRNAFKGNTTYDLPFGRGKLLLNNSRILDEVVGGWTASGTYLFSSGNPFTVFADGNTFAQAGSQYPNYSGEPVYPRHKTLAEWFNPGAFSRPANGTFGNVRRNSLVGPGIEQVNLAASKSFSIKEGIKLEIRADASNALNHPSFNPPNNRYLVAQQGTTNYAGSQIDITSTLSSPRQMQLGVHVAF